MDLAGKSVNHFFGSPEKLSTNNLILTSSSSTSFDSTKSSNLSTCCLVVKFPSPLLALHLQQSSYGLGRIRKGSCSMKNYTNTLQVIQWTVFFNEDRQMKKRPRSTVVDPSKGQDMQQWKWDKEASQINDPELEWRRSTIECGSTGWKMQGNIGDIPLDLALGLWGFFATSLRG